MPEKDCVPKAEKVTSMTLEVDLQCPSCYKKVKKILCKFPEVRDQVYDEKKNLVKITVVYCCPEKIRDKLYCKGGKVIKCIKIEVPKPTPSPPPEPCKKKCKPPPPPPPPPKQCEKECKPPPHKEPCEKKCKPPPPPPPPAPPCPQPCPPPPPPACRPPPPPPFPPPPPPPACCCCYCRGCGCGYKCNSYGRGFYVSHCDYFIEDNSGACRIM